MSEDLSFGPNFDQEIVTLQGEIIGRQENVEAAQLFLEGDEIEESRKSSDVVQAMVDYLENRGLTMPPDPVEVESGDYDGYLALAYDYAVRVVRGDADPINRIREESRDSTSGLWNFTIEPFDDVAEQLVIRDNILAAGAVDYVFELGERMGIFQLTDSLLLNWASGSIDVQGEAAARLYRHWKLRDERSAPEERGMMYRRVLNKGSGGSLDRMVVNEDFPPLWSQLLEQVAEYIDKTERIESGRTDASPVSRRGIYQATRELQYNLTEYCTGMAHMQVRELYAQLRDSLAILGNPDVLAHFGGARQKSLWTVVERLAKSEFASSPNISALRSLAADGNAIFRWVADYNDGSNPSADFDIFVNAAESYILNAALVGDEPELGSDDEEEGEGDFDEPVDDEFEDDF